jgi:hypothetical protein
MNVKKYLALAAIAAALSASPTLAGWRVDENEPDPFAANAGSTFIASESSGFQTGLAIRCLDGQISLLLLTGASTAATEGEQISLKLIADYKGVIEDDDAHIVNATNVTTSIQFGNENSLDYLKGTQRVSLHYGLGASYETLSFLGGTSMDRVIDEARKACGK